MADSEYITITELEKWGGPPSALEDVSSEDKVGAIRAISGELDAYTGSRFQNPFVTIDPSIKRHLAKGAFFMLMGVRGFSPVGDDEMLERDYDRAIRYFKAIGSGKANPASSQNDPAAGSTPDIDSEDSRGFRRDSI